jgi:hypothetical protein
LKDGGVKAPNLYLSKQKVMNKEYKDLDELGFYRWQNDHPFSEIDYSCYVAWWDDLDISSLDRTCLNALSFRFFREKYGLDYEITYAGKKGEYHAFVDEYIYGNNGSSPSVFSYEEAELECLKKLIEIAKNK